MLELEAAIKFMKRWNGALDVDPFYNSNYYMLSKNFGLDVQEDRKIKPNQVGP